MKELSNDDTQSDEDKLQEMIKFIQLIRADIQRGIEFYDKVFQQ